MTHRRNFFFFSTRHPSSERIDKSGRFVFENGRDNRQNSKTAFLKKSKVWGLIGGPTDPLGRSRFFQIFFGYSWIDSGLFKEIVFTVAFFKTFFKALKYTKTWFFGHISPDLTPLPPTRERQKCGENDSEHFWYWVEIFLGWGAGKAEKVL